MNDFLEKLAGVFFALVLAPLLPGIVNKVKAFFAGRRGPPVLQLYHDLLKLASKGAVYSRTASWPFRAGPVVALASVLTALLLSPCAGPAPVAFGGDLLLVFYLLALARFVTVVAAMDTGSSFEGMGASREVQFSAFAEPCLFIAFATLARMTGGFSLSAIFGAVTPGLWAAHAPALLLTAVVLMIVLLAENARIPVDDPNTHLELTMIHEAMILEYSGRYLALIEWGASIKQLQIGRAHV